MWKTKKTKDPKEGAGFVQHRFLKLFSGRRRDLVEGEGGAGLIEGELNKAGN